MKRILLLMITAIILTACTNEKVDKPEQEYVEAEVPKKEVISEIMSEQEHEIVLIDNDDLRMTLLKSTHERMENSSVNEKIELDIKMENKKNRTFSFFIKEFYLDGIEIEDRRVIFNEHEIAPKETKDLKIRIFTEEYDEEAKLKFDEHLRGTIIYSDYDRFRVEASFREYIIEQ